MRHAHDLYHQVIQMVPLMDRLLKLESMYLHLTPYQDPATGQDEGMLEYIPSSMLAHVTSSWSTAASAGFSNDLLIFFHWTTKKFHPDEQGPFGICQCLDFFYRELCQLLCHYIYYGCWKQDNVQETK